MSVALPAGRRGRTALGGGAKRRDWPRGLPWRRKQGRREQFPDGRGRACKPIGAAARRHSGGWMTHGSVFSCVLTSLLFDSYFSQPKQSDKCANRVQTLVLQGLPA